MMYKAMNNQTPQYISNLFTMASEIHNRNLRSAEQNILIIAYLFTLESHTQELVILSDLSKSMAPKDEMLYP